jgi:hypothetical protein
VRKGELNLQAAFPGSSSCSIKPIPNSDSKLGEFDDEKYLVGVDFKPWLLNIKTL